MLARCLVLGLLVISGGALGETPEVAVSFLVDPDRPMAYVSVDHIGLGEKSEEDGQQHRLVWLRFHNNCKLPINLVVNGEGGEDKLSKISIHYQLRAEKEGLRIISNIAQERKDELKRKRVMATMPHDLMPDVGSPYTVEAGANVLFSLRANRFSEYWSIRIPFTFYFPPGRGLRDDDVQGYVEMAVTFDLYALSRAMRDEIAADQESGNAKSGSK